MALRSHYRSRFDRQSRRSVFMIGVALGFAPFVGPPPVIACTCFGPERPCAYISDADLVVVATAIASSPDTIKGEPFNRYRFAVSKVVKGSASDEVVVASSQWSCGVRFAIGEPYLLFAHEQDGSLYTGFCSGNRWMRDSTVDLAYLDRRDGLSIYGRVREHLSEADSIGRVPVQITSESRTWRLTTDVGGRFELGGLVPATYIVHVTATTKFEPDSDPDTVWLVPGACGEVVQLVRRVQPFDTSSAVSFGLVEVFGSTKRGSEEKLDSLTVEMSLLDDIGPYFTVPITNSRFRFTVHAGQTLKLRVRGVDREGEVHAGPWVELTPDRSDLFGSPHRIHVTVPLP